MSASTAVIAPGTPNRDPTFRQADAQPGRRSRLASPLDRLVDDGILPGSRLDCHDGQEIFAEDQPAGHVYRVDAGVVRLTCLLADGRRQIVEFCLPGSYFGLAARGDYGLAAEAVGRTQVRRIERRHLDTAAAARPAVGSALLELLSDRLAQAQDRLLLLGRKSPREKLATFLLEMAACHAGGDAVAGDAVADRLRLPMRRLDIADFLGLTIETVSRLFTRFRAAGLIRLVDSATVLILDRDRLAAIADGLAD